MVIDQFGESQPIGCIIVWIIKGYISTSIVLKFINEFLLMNSVLQNL